MSRSAARRSWSLAANRGSSRSGPGASPGAWSGCAASDTSRTRRASLNGVEMPTSSPSIEIAQPPTLLPDFAFPDRVAIVIGNEGRGLSPAFRNRCAATVTIPQFGPVGSLNAAVSASIVMYELTRREPVGRPILDAKYVVDPAEDPPNTERSNEPLAGLRARKRTPGPPGSTPAEQPGR